MKHCVITTVMLLSLIVIGCLPAQGQQIPGTRNETDETVLVLPFGWDASPSAEVIAPRTAWMIRRHLRAGRFKLPEWESIDSGDKELIWKNRLILMDVFYKAGIQWVVGGDVTDVGKDPDGQWEGPRVIGVAGVPIQAEVKIKVFHVATGKDVWAQTHKLHGHSPRLRILGMGKNPFPETPAAIDAFIHDGLLEVTGELTQKIKKVDTPQ